MTNSGHLTVVGGTAVVKEAMADKKIPQDTLLPLLDAPLDDLARYLAGDTWEARKDYLNNRMSAAAAIGHGGAGCLDQPGRHCRADSNREKAPGCSASDKPFHPRRYRIRRLRPPPKGTAERRGPPHAANRSRPRLSSTKAQQGLRRSWQQRISSRP